MRKKSKRQLEVNLSQFMIPIGALKPLSELENKYVEFVGSWLEIPTQLKLTYFAHFKPLSGWSLCALKR